ALLVTRGGLILFAPFVAARRAAAKHKQRARQNDEQQRGCDGEPRRAEQSRRAELTDVVPPDLRRQFESARAVSELTEQSFEPLDILVGLARLVPKVVAHTPRPLIPNRSRRSFMPRCRFTRTEAGCSPVRAAISGPVMPSTRRSTRVSR